MGFKMGEKRGKKKRKKKKEKREDEIRIHVALSHWVEGFKKIH